MTTEVYSQHVAYGLGVVFSGDGIAELASQEPDL